MRLAVTLAFVLVNIGVFPKATIAATTTMALPDCQGKPVVKPVIVTLACGDGNFYAENLRWTGWGESFTAALGVGQANDCTPNCAAGHFHSYQMVLIATDRQTCPSGQTAYAKVIYAFVGASPYPQTSRDSANWTQKFPCKPMQ
jgi:hypothetical protein